MDDGPHNPDKTMENQLSFDLNSAIQRWRGNLAQSTSLSAASLDELESHVRDSSAALMRSGLSAEEAFLIASRRMGPGIRLESEFEKVERRTVWSAVSPRHLYGIALILMVLLLAVIAIGPLTPRGLDADVSQPPFLVR